MNPDQTGRKNPNFRHGLHGGKLYSIWKTMRQRCSNPKNPRYAYYGARGISVCDEWNDYLPFYMWAIANGYFEGMTIERKDITKGYYPGNCCWIPHGLQARNTRRNVFLTIDGVTLTQKEWSRLSGIDNSSLSKMRRAGKDVCSIIRNTYRRPPKKEA